MRRISAALWLSCLLVAVCFLQAEAANHVPKMDIHVALRRDGSAAITQIWTADTDEGTEFYLACKDNGYLYITDFSVSDELGTYMLQNHWDPDSSFEEKTGKCGIRKTEDGVELCWGISQYGTHQYTISYILHDLTSSYSDVDGFNHRFVDEMNLFPTDVVLNIRSESGIPLTNENCDIWAFGYDGQIQFEDGMIRAWSENSLEGSEHMTILLSLEKGLLSPLRSVDGSFEDVKEQAFEGSSYEKGGTFSDLLFGITLIFLIVIFIVLAAVFTAKLRKAKLDKRMKQVNYFRDAPNNGNINVTHRLSTACELCKEDSLLGAYLLRLINDGALKPEETIATSSQVDLRLVRPPVSDNLYDDAFYTILEAAAGADRVLQAKELENFCRQNSKSLAGFIDSCRQDADRTLFRGGCCRSSDCQGMKNLSEKGLTQLDEILGLKRFLLDFSLIHERSVKETVIWQDYLIYAYLLGIAAQVVPQIRKLYPEALPQVEHFERCIGYAGYYNGFMYNACTLDRQRQATRSAGSGGMASFGGGGGFSGGGGGGTR